MSIKVAPKKVTTRQMEIDVATDGIYVRIEAIRNAIEDDDLPLSYVSSKGWVMSVTDDNYVTITFGNTGSVRISFEVGDSFHKQDWENIIVPAMKRCGENLMWCKSKDAFLEDSVTYKI